MKCKKHTFPIATSFFSGVVDVMHSFDEDKCPWCELERLKKRYNIPDEEVWTPNERFD
jgi:hypothetical protein